MVTSFTSGIIHRGIAAVQQSGLPLPVRGTIHVFDVALHGWERPAAYSPGRQVATNAVRHAVGRGKAFLMNAVRIRCTCG